MAARAQDDPLSVTYKIMELTITMNSIHNSVSK